LLLQKSGVRAAGPGAGTMRSMLLLAAERSGYLKRLMWYYPFRKALGREGRRKAWVALGGQIADNVAIGPGVVMRFPEKVKVGAGSKLGGRVWIDSWGDVTIGSNVLLTGDIDLLSTQHAVDDPNLKGDRRSVTIGDYVWLALKIAVLPGVTIGDYAVIGTGAVVANDIPEYGIAVGNPARVVKERARIEYNLRAEPHIAARRPVVGGQGGRPHAVVRGPGGAHDDEQFLRMVEGDLAVEELRLGLRVSEEVGHQPEFFGRADESDLQVQACHLRRGAQRLRERGFDRRADLRLAGMEDVLREEHVAGRVAVDRRSRRIRARSRSSGTTRRAAPRPRSAVARALH